MKPIIPILALVSAFWIFGGAYYMAKTSCGTAATTVAPLSISDGELEFSTTANQHFSFLPSGHTIAIEDQAGKSLREVSQHLTEHPDRALTLNGWFLEGETNDSEYENLGIARAEEVKSFLLLQDSSLVDRILTSGEMKNAILTINEKQIDGVAFNFSNLENDFSSDNVDADLEGETDSDSESSSTLSSSSGTAPTLSLYGKEEIKNIKMDINLQQQIDNMKSVLDLNPGAYIMVTGHSEKMRTASKSEDLAYIWASNVRRFFRNNGIKSKQIKASSQGANDPLVSPDDVESSTKNNRVTVEIILPE